MTGGKEGLAMMVCHASCEEDISSEVQTWLSTRGDIPDSLSTLSLMKYNMERTPKTMSLQELYDSESGAL